MCRLPAVDHPVWAANDITAVGWPSVLSSFIPSYFRLASTALGMYDALPFARRSLLTRHWFDSDEDRFTIVADVGPATVEDLRVLVNRRFVRLDVENGPTTTSRSFRPPVEAYQFTDEKRAVLHNGVLEVTVGVDRRGTM